MSLRHTSMIFAAAFVVIGLGVALALMVLTKNLHRSAREIGAAVESVQVGEGLEFALVSLRDARDPLSRTASKELLHQRLVEAEDYVGTDHESRVLDELKEHVEDYVIAIDRAPLPEANTEVMDSSHVAFESAFNSVREWVQINARQGQAVRVLAAKWDRAANLIGISAISLLVVGLGSLALWLQRRTLRPAVNLAGAIERYAGGERTARASENGATELQTIAHQFNTMAASLERQRSDQLAFLAGVAHDLRNPLTALKMATSMVAPGQPLPSDERMRQLFGRVQRQIDRLERMVYDLLDAARIESGNLELQMTETDAGAMVRSVVELYEPATRTHQIVANLPSEPLMVICDPVRIEQVLTNLVSNAIKYSPRGGTVCVTVGRKDGDVTISVSDQGVGMSEQEIDHLFEPFRRSGASKETVPGVGLGLHVARRIVAAHGGTISVDSAVGVGSTFTVQLPG